MVISEDPKSKFKNGSVMHRITKGTKRGIRSRSKAIQSKKKYDINTILSNQSEAMNLKEVFMGNSSK